MDSLPIGRIPLVGVHRRVAHPCRAPARSGNCRYAYVRGDPADLLDPTGLDCVTAVWTYGKWNENNEHVITGSEVDFGSCPPPDGGNEGFSAGLGFGGGAGGMSGQQWTALMLRSLMDLWANLRKKTPLDRAKDSGEAILSGTSDCASWFNWFYPAPPETFASDTINTYNGKSAATKTGDTVAQPVIAFTTLDTGANSVISVISVNQNGAFFQAWAPLVNTPQGGGPAMPTGRSIALSVGPYGGNTHQGRVLALLHELAHNVGAIPSDANSASQSVANTAKVLEHCKKQIDALE